MVMPIEPSEIEITIDVQISAGVGFWVARDEWAKASDGEKRKMIGEAIDKAAILLCNDTIAVPDGNGIFISAEITGPSDEDIKIEEVSIYDPLT